LNVLFTLLLNPAIIAVCAGFGFFACRFLGADPHMKEMLAAAFVCVISAEVGVLPLLRERRGTPDALFQAGFAGTVVHLALAALLAAAVMFGCKTGNAFAWWLLAMYWLSLVGLCWVIVKRLRASERLTRRIQD